MFGELKSKGLQSSIFNLKNFENDGWNNYNCMPQKVAATPAVFCVCWPLSQDVADAMATFYDFKYLFDKL